MKQLVGLVMILGPFMAMFILFSIESGWKVACSIFGIVFLLLIWIAIGSYLLGGGDSE